MNETRVVRLSAYLRGLADPDVDGTALFKTYQADMSDVTPQEVMELFNRELQGGRPAAEILLFLDKAINALSHGLRQRPQVKPEPGTFLALLIAENDGLAARLGAIRDLLLSYGPSGAENSLVTLVPVLRDRVQDLQVIDQHYLKKENILFPSLEKKHPRFSGLAIMWALHDRARQVIRQTLADFAAPDLTSEKIRTQLGQLFFTLQGLVNKENLILNPIAAEQFSASEFRDMLVQARDYDFAFLDPDTAAIYVKAQEDAMNIENSPDGNLGTLFKSGQPVWLKTPTGNLTAEQAVQIFNALPVDLSFVDADNKVQYFTRPRDRIFPRSPAVIGRDVDNCHPPASVHVVRQIVESFRAGKRDHARFWINLKGRKVLIEYFAVRDDQGAYLGVLEVSQDITEIQELTGEQRLLDWT